jgi:hypothetical protein
MERFAARSLEEKAKAFLLFSKLLTEELENLQGTSEETPSSAPERTTGTADLSQPRRGTDPRLVKFIEVSRPGGTTIISNAPRGPPQKKPDPVSSESPDDNCYLGNLLLVSWCLIWTNGSGWRSFVRISLTVDHSVRDINCAAAPTCHEHLGEGDHWVMSATINGI